MLLKAGEVFTIDDCDMVQVFNCATLVAVADFDIEQAFWAFREANGHKARDFVVDGISVSESDAFVDHLVSKGLARHYPKKKLIFDLQYPENGPEFIQPAQNAADPESSSSPRPTGS